MTVRLKPLIQMFTLLLAASSARSLAAAPPPPPVSPGPPASPVTRESDLLSEDARLNRPIDLDLRAGDLKQLAELLTQKIGMRFYVAPELADVKLTVLADKIPVRSVMEQTAKLFNMTWRRHGEGAGKYRYQLTQTLQERLAEEDRRQADGKEMLRNLLTQLEELKPYKDTPKEGLERAAEEIRQKAAGAKSEAEKKRWETQASRLDNLRTHYSLQSAVRMYSTLSPEGRSRFIEGEETTYKWGDRTLPRDLAERVRESGSENSWLKEMKISELPLEDLDLELGYYLERNKEDRIEFIVKTKVGVKKQGYTVTTSNPLAGFPNRFQADRKPLDPDLPEQYPVLKSKVAIQPEPDPLPDATAKTDADPAGNENDNPLNFIDTADYFAELHRKTGLPIVADYYLRTYPKAEYKAEGTPVAELLNQAADRLFSEWAMDGGIVRFRRHNYFSERLLDVPNRMIARWKAVRSRSEYPTLDTLSEMASLPEAAFKLWDLELGLKRKHGFEKEWELAGNNRNALVLYGSLPPDQRLQMVSEAGLPMAGLRPDQTELCAQPLEMTMPEKISPEEWEKSRLLIHFRRPGTYEYVDWNKVRQPVLLAPSTYGKSWDKASGEEREKDRTVAQERALALAKSLNLPEAELSGVSSKVYGPIMGIVFQMQIGSHYWTSERSPNGSSTNDGVVAGMQEQ